MTPIESKIVTLLHSLSTSEQCEEIGPTTHLIKTGVLDSLTVVELSAKLEEAFAAKIDARDINPAGFSTVRAIGALVERSVRSS